MLVSMFRKIFISRPLTLVHVQAKLEMRMVLICDRFIMSLSLSINKQTVYQKLINIVLELPNQYSIFYDN